MSDNPPPEARYSSDAPLPTREGDLFDRWPFAERVGHVLRDRREASSLVVGLYGTWGEGKTTVLNFIEEALAEAEGVVVVRFNPWRFGEESVLIQRFFRALADGVGAKLTTRKDDVMGFLAKYSGALSGTAALATGVLGAGLDPQKAFEALATVDLEETKQRLEAALAEAGLRVVVRIDDIDRLDKDEVQAVFRLVKLSADFEHVAYVLALDPDVVAAALQERYGPGQERAGYDFLEKIVTVPLQIPPARSHALYGIVVEAVNEALELSGADVPDGGQRFAEAFHEGLLLALNTPRMAKRYGNAVRFALPILAGEVDATDQLLIEGMRVMYPSLYDHVRTNEAVYLRRSPRDLFASSDTIERREAMAVEVDRVIAERVPGGVGPATVLIDMLFPAARGRNHSDASEARRGQRAASDWYFERYFTYAVPSDSIAERDLTELVTLAEGGDEDAVTARLGELVTPERYRRLAEALAFRASSVPPTAVRALGVSIARLAERFATEGGALEWRPPRWQAIAAAGVMVRQIPEGSERNAAAEAVMRACPTIETALSLIGWFQPEGAGEKGPILDEAERDRLRAIIADQIIVEAARQAPHLDPSANAASRYWIWAEHRSRTEVADYIGQRLRDKPGEVVALLRSQVPDVWVGGASESYPGEYDRGVYDAAVAYLDPEDVATALRSVYGAEVLDAGWVEMDYVRMGLKGYESVTEDEGLARQFMAVHRSATADGED